MMIRGAREWVLLACSAAFAQPPAAGGEPGHYDVLISGGTGYDGLGGAPFVGDVGITGDRLAYVGPHASGAARERIDAHGKAVAPGFVNMLAHPEESLLADGRALSDLRQGVTLEVLGEDSMGPLTPEMKRLATQRQADIRYTIDWTTLGEYLHRLERGGIAPNVASFVGAGTRAQRGSASARTCTCIRRARRVSMPPCPRGCRTEAWRRGSRASRTRRSAAACWPRCAIPRPPGRISMARPARPARCCSASR